MALRREAAKGIPFNSPLSIADVTFSISAETSNGRTVSMVLKSANGKTINFRGAVQAYISTDAEGDDLAATAPTTSVIGTNGVSIPLIAAKAFILVSEVTGLLDLVVTRAAAVTYYLIVILPDGTLKSSGAITLAG